MPMKWTPENDHLLLLKILECSPGLTIDGKKIAAAWPTDRGEVPTPRAITEHVISIRKKIGNIAGGSDSNSQDDGVTKPKKASPRKRTAKDPNATPKPRAPRKKKIVKVEEEGSEPSEDIKEGMDDEDEDIEESPTKRQKFAEDDENGSPYSD